MKFGKEYFSMVRKHSDFKFDEFLKNWQAEKPRMAAVVAAKAEKHFKDSFRNQGFTDTALSRWRPRKALDAGRNILVKTGRLMRSIRATIVNSGLIRISSDSSYGRYNNEGTSTLPQRQFIGESKVLNENIQKEIDKTLKRVFK